MGIPQSRMSLRRELSEATTRPGEELAVMSLVIRKPKLINARTTDDSRRPLHHAVLKRNPLMVEMLLKLGAKVDSRDLSGRTPLHQAAICGTLECTNLLVEHGASIEAREDWDHCTPLLDAARTSRGDIVAFLLHQKANPLAIDSDGRNALHLCESASIAKDLLEFDYLKVKQNESHPSSVAFKLLSSRDFVGRTALERTKEQANRVRRSDYMLPFIVEKLAYVESFTQTRLAVPDGDVDRNRVHLDMAVMMNQKLSASQSRLAQKTYDVLCELEIHQVALPILGYLAPLDVITQPEPAARRTLISKLNKGRILFLEYRSKK